jgi:hypothetical protein
MNTDTPPPAQPWLIEIPAKALTKGIREEWQEYLSATEEEKGLLSASVAARILGVSHQAVDDLLKRKKLTRLEFFGHGWISGREVLHRLTSPREKSGPKPRALAA